VSAIIDYKLHDLVTFRGIRHVSSGLVMVWVENKALHKLPFGFGRPPI
jgi:hypothetical protein